MVLELERYFMGDLNSPDISFRGFLQDNCRGFLLVKTGADKSSLRRKTGSDLLKLELEEMVEVVEVQL